MNDLEWSARDGDSPVIESVLTPDSEVRNASSAAASLSVVRPSRVGLRAAPARWVVNKR
jgi:hypothetical protein